MEISNKNIEVFNKAYAFITLFFILSIISEAFISRRVENVLLSKVIDYSFWFSLGLFTAFYAIRRIFAMNK